MKSSHRATTSADSPFDQRYEIGPWLDISTTLDGDSAWRCLSRMTKQYGQDPRPYCVYVHVPFCASICSYCCLYTRAVRANANAVFDEYIENVSEIISRHPNTRSTRAPTTVHFGGGTPLHLGLKRFEDLTRTLRNAFGDDEACEWALETTTSSMDPDTMSALYDLRFRRIHLGIQTLDNTLRKQLRRHESGELAIRKIRELLDKGFDCSVDLIIGFENSTEHILLDDLQRLYDAGIRMFSISELRLKVRKNAEADSILESQRNYRYWSIIWRFMQSVGLRPIHLGQFGESQESNLYYTHPARKEDCIALGPYAHGSADRLYYSNLLIKDYYQAIRQGNSPVASAVVFSDGLETIRDLERGLLAHEIPQSSLDLVVLHYPEFERILTYWHSFQLLVQDESRSVWTLSMNGSWFVGNMIAQARSLASRIASHT